MSHNGNDAWYERKNDEFLEDYGSLVKAVAEYHGVMANQSSKTENEVSFEIVKVACKLFPKWKQLIPSEIFEKAMDFYDDYIESGSHKIRPYKTKEGKEILPNYFEPKE